MKVNNKDDTAVKTMRLELPSGVVSYLRVGLPLQALGCVEGEGNTLSGTQVLAASMACDRFCQVGPSTGQNLAGSAFDSTLCDVLKEANITARPVEEAHSTATHGYDTTGILIPSDNWPYFVTLEPNMLDLMMDDLYERLLPTYPVNNHEALANSRLLIQLQEKFSAESSISNEPSVRLFTHEILKACVWLGLAVGLDPQFETHEEDKLANVKIDSRIQLTTGGGIAVEDISPKAYTTHCSDQNVEEVCGQSLVLRMNETGFRGILLKLSQYMIRKKFQWGYIHGGVYLRVVRVEWKNERPFIIISRNIPVNSSAPSSMYSIICYMLFTAREDSLQIFQNARNNVPEPPSILKTGPNLRRHTTVRQGGAVPENIQELVVHTTAGGGSIPVDIPMHRKNSGLEKGSKVDLEVTHFLGAGEYGRVFQCDAFVDSVFLGVLVLKLVLSKDARTLDVEEAAYNTLHPLYDIAVPRFYGHFSGNFNGTKYSALLLGHGGEPLKSTDDLSVSERLDLRNSILKIHREGVVHRDIHSGNIMRSKDGIWVIDFSLATLGHECQGLYSCKELGDVTNRLKLSA